MNEADLSWRFCHGYSVMAISLCITLTAWAAFCDGRAGRSAVAAKSLF
jgi:hypothetical protein